MGRSPCCDESGLKKGPWTPEEDEKLLQYIQKNGHGSWRTLPRLAGLNRCGKSCRLRWTNYLRPDIKRGKFSQDEEQTILHLHSILGNKYDPVHRSMHRIRSSIRHETELDRNGLFPRRWSAIATHLPGRTDNEIKNFWNTHLKKRLIQMGFDPMTHRPRTDFFAALPQLIALATLRDQLAAAAAGGGGGVVDPSVAAQLQGGGAGGGADVAIQAAKMQYLQCLLQSAATTIATAGSGVGGGGGMLAPAMMITSGGDVEANLRLIGCGAGAGDAYACHGHGGALPPLADLSDVTTANPVADWCSATASSSCGGGGGGASSPFPWPEFCFPDDPFITDFL
uniref:Uncharacterized protein n=1 Tax=Leersia perrieri TaxID=77586 RepID=A0A0D9X945_9ORYZ